MTLFFLNLRLKALPLLRHYLIFFGLILSTLNTVNAQEFQASFVGSSACIACHQEQNKAWQGSHHDMSMGHATAKNVQGNFDNQLLTFKNKENRFYRKKDQYWVKIEGPDKQLHDYQIKYTFGYYPLQQYMVEFDDGRIQLIPFAWDARPKSENGQRWFDLYPEYTQKHQTFYWTNTGQNWNYMCADCHSTNVKKNFDVNLNQYNTSYSEINVGCEACHGPASEHIEWSKGNTTHSKKSLTSYGFDRNLSKSVENWLPQKGFNTLKPQHINKTDQTLVCAQCHSRHVQISDKDHIKSNEFADRYILSLINERLYYPDGQVLDEDFVYGSFLQSKMARNGVVCSNCHDPHSAKLTLPKEAVCTQCHQSSVYKSPKHHHHTENSAGAQCINCHMPETVFMQIDGRRDHRWHIPRPDHTRQLGTPNVCLDCHEDKTNAWSEKTTASWYDLLPANEERHFAPVFSAADAGYSQASRALSQIAQDNQYADIIRASALDRMRPFINTNTLIAIVRSLKHDDSNIRLGAINGAAEINGAERWRILAPLLSDKVLAVRAQAAFALVSLWGDLSSQQQAQLQPALNDYLDIQAFNYDRGFAHTNKANVLVYQGRFAKALTAYKKSIEIDPFYATAYINMSDYYRSQQQNDLAINILKQGLKTIPKEAQLAYGLGLAFIRQQEKPKAIGYFKKATLWSPENANYHYLYGLSLEAVNLKQAQTELLKAYELSANPQHLYTLCEVQVRHKLKANTQCPKELLNSLVP